MKGKQNEENNECDCDSTLLGGIDLPHRMYECGICQSGNDARSLMVADVQQLEITMQHMVISLEGSRLSPLSASGINWRT